MEKELFTSEAVSEGHPDKVCDQIADSILDECLSKDKNSHVACEVFASEEYILVGGEITSNSNVDYEKITRDILRKIGYTKPEIGIGCDTCKVDIKIKKQSQEINNAVVKDDILNQGAGDQGIIFGYATDEMPNYMPVAFSIAQDIMKLASTLRKQGIFKDSRPDMKSQVTYDYKNRRIDNVLVSIQHNPNIDMNKFRSFIKKEIIDKVINNFRLNLDYDLLINPSGSFVIGGPKGDTGLTGRKLIVDTYGGSSHNGGGALSGKDPSKVDRSAQYYARYIAKNLVAAGVAKRLEVQISYAIGVAKPLSISVLTFKTSKYSDQKIIEIINKLFDLRPGAIIEQFNLLNPDFKYFDTSCYGHFGREDINFPWEKLDKVNAIKALLV